MLSTATKCSFLFKEIGFICVIILLLSLFSVLLWLAARRREVGLIRKSLMNRLQMQILIIRLQIFWKNVVLVNDIQEWLLVSENKIMLCQYLFFIFFGLQHITPVLILLLAGDLVVIYKFNIFFRFCHLQLNMCSKTLPNDANISDKIWTVIKEVAIIEPCNLDKVKLFLSLTSYSKQQIHD